MNADTNGTTSTRLNPLYPPWILIPLSLDSGLCSWKCFYYTIAFFLEWPVDEMFNEEWDEN